MSPILPLEPTQFALISGVSEDVIQVSITSGSPLNAELPQDGQLATGAGLSNGSIGSDSSAAITGELKTILAGYASKGVPAALVDAAKKGEIAGAEFQRNSITDLASTWSEALAGVEAFKGDV